jgi:membrane protease YdiL (CAAX protease family)
VSELAAQLRPVPEPPELPIRARPFWPAWYGPAALVASFVALFLSVFPVLPALVAFGTDEDSAFTLLAGILVQDAFLVAAAFVFASIKLSPRKWHFGLRAVRPWPAVGWVALGFVVMIGFELGFLALIGSDATNNDLGSHLGAGEAIASGLAVIVIAPITEELFFRGFFYRALRTRMWIWLAALIDGAVFASLHYQGADTAGAILPVIAFFGIGQCLLYERTGSLFAVIAVHALFNTFASLDEQPVVALVIGALMLTACFWVPRRLGAAPSPFGADPRARPAPA